MIFLITVTLSLNDVPPKIPFVSYQYLLTLKNTFAILLFTLLISRYHSSWELPTEVLQVIYVAGSSIH